mgnify:CR=1 FL=1
MAAADSGRYRRTDDATTTTLTVRLSREQGESLGVDATPTIYINGRDCDLSKLGNPVKDLEDWIDLEIKSAAKDPNGG